MGLKIKGIEIATGNKTIDMKYYIDYFKNNYYMDIEHFIKDILGKKQKYVCDNSQNTLTMALESVQKVLTSTNTKGNEIDMIVFSSQFPEYTMPSQACLIHNLIEGKEDCFVMDININCIGMLRGLDIINTYMQSGKVKKALLIGSDRCNTQYKKDDSLFMTAFGDASCSVLLEYTEKDKGIIGSVNKTWSSNAWTVRYPQCGMSKIYENIDSELKKVLWTNSDLSIPISYMSKSMYYILDKNNLTTNDIDWMCPSQFTVELINKLNDNCNIQKDKTIYIGDTYGYTGTTSPFIALYEGIKQGKIKENELVLLTSFALGATINSTIIKL